MCMSYDVLLQVVVNKSILDDSLLPLLTDEPTMLPAWDPMGSLATVRPEAERGLAGEGLDDLKRCRI